MPLRIRAQQRLTAEENARDLGKQLKKENVPTDCDRVLGSEIKGVYTPDFLECVVPSLADVVREHLYAHAVRAFGFYIRRQIVAKESDLKRRNGTSFPDSALERLVLVLLPARLMSHYF